MMDNMNFWGAPEGDSADIGHSRAMSKKGDGPHIALIETGRNVCFGGGDSGPTNTTSTNTTTNIPEYARPYFERLMDRSEAVTNEGYVPYGGQRVAGMTGAQNEAAARIGSMTEPGQIRDATNLMGTAAQGALRTSTFQPGYIGSTYRPTATQMFQGPNQVQATFRPGEFNAQSADRYMSPYEQNVINATKRESNQQFDQQNVARDAAAAQKGAFGGSRAALVQQEALRGHNNELNDIQNKGMQQSYENAQAQFERDRQAGYQASQQGLGASQFNSQQQMAYGQAGLQNQQYNEQQRQQAAAMALQGQTANEAARAAAMGIQQKGYGLAGDMATGIGNLGNMQQTLALQRAQALDAVGQRQQALQQAQLDANYQEFVNQRDYEKNQVAFNAGILRGIPVTPNSDVQTYAPAPSPWSQVAGLGIAGAGAYGALNSGTK